MSIQFKLRRGTTAQHSTFTGASGEVTVDTDKKVLVVHDNATAGGNPLLSAAAGAVGTTNLAANAVTTAKIAAGAVTATQIATDAVTSTQILDGSVGTAELAANAVTSAKIAAGAVGSTQIATDAVTATQIAAGAVGTSELADSNVTPAKLSQPLTQGTAQATTSGTTKDFTIPSWAKRITVLFAGVSTAGASDLLVQIGAGSVTTTGYSAGSGRASGSSAAGASSTAGFLVYSNAASNVISGVMTLALVGSNTWVASHAIGYGAGGSATGGGSITLGGTLDRVRVTSATPDAFDLGSVNVLFE